MTGFISNRGDLKETYHNITDVEIDDFEVWTMAWLRLKSIDTKNNIAYLTRSSAMNHNSGFIAGHRYLVENVQEALSEPGEWYLDRAATPSTLTYIPKPGEDPRKTTVVAPQLEQMISAENLNYVTFQGIAFEHSNWVVPAIGHESFPGGVGDRTAKPESRLSRPPSASLKSASYVVLDGCVVAHVGGWGVEFVGRGPFQATPVNQVINSAVHYDIGAGGIRVWRPAATGRIPRRTCRRYNLVRHKHGE